MLQKLSIDAPSSGGLAFIVDDEPQVRALVSNALAWSGYKTRQFSDALQLEAGLAEATPELIVLDLSLGNSDAIEVIRDLAATSFAGAVLLISGHDTSTLEEVREIGDRRGLKMLPVLHKPFRIDELREIIATIGDHVATDQAGLSLGAALKAKWLELWYQPKIDLRTRLVCGAEALIRLRHPEHGIALPGRFLPPAGDSLYLPLTNFIVQQALGDWSMFAERGMLHRLAINVPASVLQRPDFVASLRRYLPDHPKFPGLIVEITEDEAISDPELAREIAIQLKLYNVHVSIDDFGSGHSTLGRLNELPFAEIKLDRSFVQGCSSDARKRQMCEAVMELSRRFDICAVAEGVETLADLQTLIGMGYRVAQGFFFARPMPRDDFANLVVSRAVPAATSNRKREFVGR